MLVSFLCVCVCWVCIVGGSGVCVQMSGRVLHLGKQQLFINTQLSVTLKGHQISGRYMWNVRNIAVITSTKNSCDTAVRLVTEASHRLSQTGWGSVALLLINTLVTATQFEGVSAALTSWVSNDWKKGFYQSSWSNCTQWIKGKSKQQQTN